MRVIALISFSGYKGYPLVVSVPVDGEVEDTHGTVYSTADIFSGTTDTDITRASTAYSTVKPIAQ